jgi:ABC-type thiamin/hydroxymethylpyrimidine transport system permease subunit
MNRRNFLADVLLGSVVAVAGLIFLLSDELSPFRTFLMDRPSLANTIALGIWSIPCGGCSIFPAL